MRNLSRPSLIVLYFRLPCCGDGYSTTKGDVLPDLVEEIVHLLQGTGAEPLETQVRALRLESICDCGVTTTVRASRPPPRSGSPTSSSSNRSRGQSHYRSQPPPKKICFIEVLGRPDIRYLIEEYFASLK